MNRMATHRLNQRHAGTGTGRDSRPWPLLLIAAPAAVAVWSGWVGLGSMCGFGPVNLLPGIGSGFHLNTAITLPVGVEAYGAYALYVWLGCRASQATRDFARKSAIGALALGCLGQIAFHLLDAAHWTEAPWPVVVLVACLPVATLTLAAALVHLTRADARAAELAAAEAAARAEARAAAKAELPAGSAPRKRTGTARPERNRKQAGTDVRNPAPDAAPELAPAAEPEPAAETEETVGLDAEARILQLVGEGVSASKAGVLVGKSDSYGRQVVRTAKKLAEAAPEGQDAGQAN